MAIRDYLPPLVANHSLPPLRASGEWIPTSPDYLDRLADALDVFGVTASVADVVSIPDVWAHPLVFAAAWSDTQHVLHSQAQGEWRGLLAILALAKHLELNIEFIPINLSELSENPWGTSVPQQDHEKQPPNLLRILAEFTPPLTLGDEESWTNIAVIACHNKPLGLVVPTLLVCPARDYMEALPDEVYWRSDREQGHLIDPTATDRISWGECQTIVEYLQYVWTNNLLPTLNHVTPNHPKRIRWAGNLRDAFEAYLKQARSAENQLKNRGVWTGRFSVCDINPGRPRGGPYPFLATTIDVSIPNTDTAPSEVIMPARNRLKQHGFKGAVLLDRTIAEDRNCTPREICVWGPYTLEQTLNSPSVKERVVNAAEEQGYAVLTTEDLFTEKIFEIGNGEILYHPHSVRQFLIPLKPLALSMFRPEKLRSQISIVRDAETVAVNLSLSLLSRAGQEHSHTLRKVYTAGYIQKVTRPVMALWPDFSSDLWNHYLVFFSGQVGSVGPANFIPRQVFSMSSFLGGLPNGGNNQKLVHHLTNPAAFDSLETVDAMRLPMTPVDVTGAFWSKFPVEAIICETLSSNGQIKQLAGLLLLEPAAENPSQSLNEGAWKVGIDFGTTNTSIYLGGPSDHGTPPHELCFSPRLQFPFAPFEDTDEITLRRHFLPPREQSRIPFLSALQEREISHISTWRPFFGRRVRYIRYVNQALRDLREDNGHGRIYFDLKWSNAAANLRRVEDYLAQIALQSLAELLSQQIDPRSVEWYFSYPGSFSVEKIESFERIYVESIKAALGETMSAPNVPIQPETRLESEAAARYFRNVDKIAFGHDVITIDVGGATSDICIWSGRRSIWQTSQRLAGQHILIDYLASHLDFVDLLRQAELASTKAELETLKDERLQQGLEIFINNDLFDQAYRDNIRHVQTEPLFLGLRNVARLSLAGLIYYLALAARHLHQRGLLSTSMSDLRFCFGGRGSLVFREIDVQQSNEELINTMFSSVSGITVEHTSFHYSKQPKHEVAFGLMIPPVGADDLDSSHPCEATILGEKMQFGNQSKDPWESLGIDDVNGAWRIDALPEFEKFVAKFQSLYGVSVPLQRFRHDLIARVANDMDNIFFALRNDIKKTSSSVHRSEAVFIVSLRNLLSLLNENQIIIE